ncbi:hypothetical protein D918_02103 [Trichuris suis]|nr:hypothetical protein D918_02103 [Trichuris suis]
MSRSTCGKRDSACPMNNSEKTESDNEKYRPSNAISSSLQGKRTISGYTNLRERSHSQEFINEPRKRKQKRRRSADCSMERDYYLPILLTGTDDEKPEKDKKENGSSSRSSENESIGCSTTESSYDDDWKDDCSSTTDDETERRRLCLFPPALRRFLKLGFWNS